MGRYHHESYWKNLHVQRPGRLSTVGHPELSEALNRLKYGSEAESFLETLSELAPAFRNRERLCTLDIGAGTGYWSEILHRWSASQRIPLEMNALDISEEALAALKERYPWIAVHQGDLTGIERDLFAGRFDIVTAFYCIHHLVSIYGFLHALEFACRSVRRGGFLVLADPILGMCYSEMDRIDLAHYRGNGIPRHLHIIEEVAFREGLVRHSLRPAVSFLLNGNIEAGGFYSFTFCRAVWVLLRQVYAREGMTIRIGGVVKRMDRWLKARRLSYSSTIAVYRKAG